MPRSAARATTGRDCWRRPSASSGGQPVAFVEDGDLATDREASFSVAAEQEADVAGLAAAGRAVPWHGAAAQAGNGAPDRQVGAVPRRQLGDWQNGAAAAAVALDCQMPHGQVAEARERRRVIVGVLLGHGPRLSVPDMF